MEYVCLAGVVIFFMIIFFIWQNNGIVITEIEYKNKKIPKSFEDFKILHVSDFHNKKFGENQKGIVDKIRLLNPDIIVITGDTIDCHRTNPDVAYKFLEGIVKVAPVYLISGNHEHSCCRYEELIQGYKKAGVYVIDDESIDLTLEDDKIVLFGVSDTKATKFGDINLETEEIFETKLKKLSKACNSKNFNILLAHRPELVYLYSKYNFDLILSGHAHGGQFRFWFIKGFIAPGQGLFPKYTSGLYNEKNTSMIVSRGLGNSVIPIRIFNRPELVMINLKK